MADALGAGAQGVPFLTSPDPGLAQIAAQLRAR